jgi:hypothetical protein
MSTSHGNESILSRLQAWAETDPDKLAFAILDGRAEIESKLNFGELWQRSLQAGSWMLQRVSPGDRVALVLPTSIDFVLAYYGCLVAGVLPVPALEGGGEVVGVIPESLATREGARMDLTELRVVGSMHERKAVMAHLASAFMAIPGGLGTLEEFFEV